MGMLIIAVAFALGFGARRLGLPPLVGFLIAGFVLRAVGIASTSEVQLAADLGVTLLMFTIGLKLNLGTLSRPVVWAGTTLHTASVTLIYGALLFSAATIGLGSVIGEGPWPALLIAFALSFSSTVFAVKVLDEKRDSNATYGRIAIAVLIMQDLLAVAFMVFAAGAIPTPYALALLALIPARPLLHRMAAATGHGELLVVFGLFLALVVGYSAFDATGLKGDLGALAVGVLLGSHPKSREIGDALYSLKELLLIGFFVNIGLSSELLWTSVGMALGLILLLPIKVVLYFLIFTRLGLRARGSTLAALALATESEFGLIVTKVGVEAGWLDAQWLVTVAVALSASLIIASPINARAYRFYERFAGRLRRFERTTAGPRLPRVDLTEVDVLIFGMGRVGMGAYEVLNRELGSRVIAVDHDSERVRIQSEAGRRVIRGDALDHEFWDELGVGLPGLHLIVLALNDQASNLEILRLLRTHQYSGRVAAIARYDDDIQALERAGAHAVHNFYSEAGSGLAEHGLRLLRS